MRTELACVCLFGSVKAGDLGWFMTQKQRLHFTQKEEKSDSFFFLTLRGPVLSPCLARLLRQVYKTRPDPGHYFHSVGAATDA